IGSDCSCSLNERNSLPLRASQPTSDNIVELKTRIDELGEFWATQIAANIAAEILQNPPMELKHTSLQISSCQVETSSWMPDIGIKNAMGTATRELVLMEDDAAGSMTETHCMQPPPPNTPQKGKWQAPRRSSPSSSEFWATQMASNDFAKILENLLVELKHTGLWISTSQVKASSQMPCIGIANVMDA